MELSRLLSLEDCLPYIQNVINPGNFTEVSNILAVDDANENSLVFIASKAKNKRDIITSTKARVIITDESDIIPENKCALISNNPKLTFARIVNALLFEKHPAVVHPTAVIHPDAVIDKTVSIGAGCYIGNCKVAANTVIHPNVTIYDNVEIGHHCVIDSGTVIGAAGFGFVRDENDIPVPFPQLGGVKIGSFVEIGANVCIDRGALKDTIIKDHVKIDNFSQVAHNVVIEENTLIMGTALAGSTHIGRNCHIAGQIVMNQKSIGDNITLGLGSVVLSNLKPNNTYIGYPAVTIEKFQHLQYKLKNK